MISAFKHSHKKRRDNLERRVVLIEISVLSWNLRTAQNIEDHFEKIWLSLKGSQLFAGDFDAGLDGINANILQFLRDWIWKMIV